TTSARIVSEGDGTAWLTVALSEPTGQVVTVDYAVTGGSATSGADYVLAGGPLVFQPGVATQSIAGPPVADGRPQPDETLQVSLTSANNAVLGSPGTLTLTLTDQGGDASGLVHVQMGSPRKMRNGHIRQVVTLTNDGLALRAPVVLRLMGLSS